MDDEYSSMHHAMTLQDVTVRLLQPVYVGNSNELCQTLHIIVYVRGTKLIELLKLFFLLFF